MAICSGQELRDKALVFREMANDGSDFHLKAALLLVAEEFEREAERVEAVAAASSATTGAPMSPHAPVAMPLA